MAVFRAGKIRFFDFAIFITNHFATYKKVKQDEVLRPKSKMFGVRALVLILCGLALIPLLIYLIAMSLGSGSIGGVMVGIIILIPITIMVIFYFAFYSLLCVIAQLRLNKRAIGWVTLVLWIIMLALSIVGTFLIISGL